MSPIETSVENEEGRPTNGLERFAGDSEFGPEWQRYLEADLNEVDKEVWQ